MRLVVGGQTFRLDEPLLTFPAGAQSYDEIDFDTPNQRVQFSSGAVLSPRSTASTVTSSVPGVRVDGLRLQTHLAVERLLRVTGAGTELTGLDISALRAVEAVRIENVVGVKFFGGRLKGDNSNPSGSKNPGVGLHLAEGAHEVKAFGLTVDHWGTPLRFSGNTCDDPFFSGCNFENGNDNGVEFVPTKTGSVIYNLGFQGCHFEGFVNNIYIGPNGVIQAGSFVGARFGSRSRRVVKCDGILDGVTIQSSFLDFSFLATDAAVWELNKASYRCGDLFNNWKNISTRTQAVGTGALGVTKLPA